jgi:hypothetical protein
MNLKNQNKHATTFSRLVRHAAFICVVFLHSLPVAHSHATLSPIDGLDARYLELVEQASSDHYTARPDNMISDDQVRHFLYISKLAMDKYDLFYEQVQHSQKHAYQLSCFKPLYRLSVAIAAKSTAIALLNTDSGEVYSKTLFNYAEYDWIYRQLRQASVLKNLGSKVLDDSAEHNIDMLNKHIDQIQPILDFC